MKLNLKPLAVSAALLTLLCAGAAPLASAASPLGTVAAISLPWKKVALEGIDTGSYSHTMTIGTTQTLTPVLTPSNASDVSYTMTCDNTSVLTIDESGTVTAVGLGTANITVSAGEYSCVYTITTELDESMIVAEMDITLAASAIYVGDSTTLSLSVLPTTAAEYASVSLSSSNEKVATVNNFGKVTGVSAGTATITATCGDVTASANIRVVEYPSSSSSSTTTVTQTITLNTNYIVLKPGASKTITGKVSPSSASQKLTFKSQDSNVATVSGSGVVTGISTGSTSIIVSNGKATASVAVIVNRNASTSDGGNNNGDGTDGTTTVTDPIVEQITASEDSVITLSQSDIPVVSGEVLNTLRTSGKTLVVNGENYSLRIDGSRINNTATTLDTALTFSGADNGETFILNNGSALPGSVEITLTGDETGYSRLYLFNTATEKWQFLNSYADGTITADTAGEYLLTNQNLRFTSMNWTFFILGGITVVACVIAYIVIKKRYWFW